MANATARKAATKVLKGSGHLTPREKAAAAQPTAAKAQAVYNGPAKFDTVGRKAPRMQHPGPQFQPTIKAPAHVDIGAQSIAARKGRK